jgi:hypothetical protein
MTVTTCDTCKQELVDPLTLRFPRSSRPDEHFCSLRCLALYHFHTTGAENDPIKLQPLLK